METPVNHRFVTFAGPDLVALSQGNALGDWMRVSPAGTVRDRGGRGPFQFGGLKELQALVARSLKHAASTELMVDYDHQAEPNIRGKFGGRAEAAGWVKKLEAREDGIWAQIDWTEAAREKITAGAYRYLSPLFTADKQGKVGLLMNVALVNMPAFDLEAVAASFNFETETDLMDKVAAALGLKAGASEDAIVAAATALSSTITSLATALHLDATAKSEDIEKAVSGLVDQGGKIAAAFGLDAKAGTDELVAMATQLKDGKSDEPDPAKYVPIAAMQEVQKRLNTVEAAMATDKATAAVDEAVKAGKLIPAQRTWAMSLASKDLPAFEEYVKNAVALTDQQMAEVGHKPPRAEITALSAAQKGTAKLLGIPDDQYLKTLQGEQEDGE